MINPFNKRVHFQEIDVCYNFDVVLLKRGSRTIRPVLLIILLALIQPLIADTIHITNGEWEPYLSEYSYEYGIASHIVTEAVRE